MSQPPWDNKDPGLITKMVNQAYTGDDDAKKQLLPLVYQELKRIAAQQRRRQSRPSEMLNTTAVVNEAWLRLYNHEQDYQNRYHFLAVAAVAMRQLLIDEARKQLRDKRGAGEVIRVTVGDNLSVADQAAWLVSLDQALDKLDRYNSRLKEVFELRFFAGLTEQEIANVLNISERTVQRDWSKAKAMLALAL